MSEVNIDADLVRAGCACGWGAVETNACRRCQTGRAPARPLCTCRRIRVKARAKGAPPGAILERLYRAEQKMLARDRLSRSAMAAAQP